MAAFDLQAFVALPSLDIIEKCRKDDLLLIATHYEVQVSRQTIKKDVRIKVVEKLRELGVLAGPSSAATTPLVGSEAGRVVTPVAHAVEEQTKAEMGIRATLPRFDPFSPSSSGSLEARAKVRITRLQLEAQEKAQARQAELDFKLAIRKLELDVDREVRLRELEIRAMKIVSSPTVQPDNAPSPPPPSPVPSPAAALVELGPAPSTFSSSAFDVSKHITLVPPFKETEVDTCVFERIATALNWPREVWSLLLQCKLVGKAQEVCSSLPLQDSLQYDLVKVAILRAYELVPEAYRQKIRAHRKSSSQTFVEFAREKETLLDKWYNACKVSDFVSLRELILLEEFKNCLPERVVIYLNERKVLSLSEAAVLADEYMLTHKSVYKPAKVEPTVLPERRPKVVQSARFDECFYCRKPGHLIADCPTLKRKQEKTSNSSSKSIALVDTRVPLCSAPETSTPDPSYQPFITEGTISLEGSAHQYSVRILRDTGATQSFVLAGKLPFSNQSFCGSHVSCRGIAMKYVKVPLHRVSLDSCLATGEYKVGVCPSLPVEGVTFIMGNDIAGGKVIPVLEVLDSPKVCDLLDEVSENHPTVFPACVVTRAKARFLDDVVDLSGSFLAKDSSPEPDLSDLPKTSEQKMSSIIGEVAAGQLSVSRDRLVECQKADADLRKYFSGLSSAENLNTKQVAFFLNQGVLMRKWSPRANAEAESVYQILIPAPFRQHVLQLAHDHPWSGHLGVTKTYCRVLKHFFWPGLRKDVADFCRSCHICQCTGKPNQVIPPAPLCPIPVIGEPFERVLVDCVGLLVKTKSGNQYLLTIMCAATRFPEAIPLRKITASVVVRSLIKFFTTFGLPKIVRLTRVQTLCLNCSPRSWPL